MSAIGWYHLRAHNFRYCRGGFYVINLAVMKILSKQKQPISAELIAEMIDEDEYDVEEVLESWREFLHQETIEGENLYRLYHSHFRDWLTSYLLDK